MKKTYETPDVEVVKFQYRDQVVVASAGDKVNTTTCTIERSKMDSTSTQCMDESVQYDL